MTPEPLPKAIHEKALELGINEIVLNWSGGNDEGYLNVEYDKRDVPDYFNDMVENWAWDAYYYNGAGDGNDYGDDISYNLKENTVHTSEWFYERQERDGGTVPLEITEEGAETEEEEE
jgi:hypothetical protein